MVWEGIPHNSTLDPLGYSGFTRALPRFRLIGYTWRFRGSYKWGYKSPSMGYKFSYPTCNATYNYP